MSKIENKYNKKKVYKSTKHVNVSLINPAFDFVRFSSIIGLFNN